MKKNITFMFILVFLISIYISINAYTYACNISSNLEKNIFRLHIIANSDSEEDQNLKYTVRNSLLEYMNNLCIDCSNKQEIIKKISYHQNDFQKIAETTIKNEGFSYKVNIKIGNFKFPTKNYGDISFPAGYYDALRVEIGNAQGKNWWCVMFPPLCFINTNTGIVSESSKEILQNNLDTEELKIISENKSPNIKIKFKIVEFFQNSDLLTAKNN